MACILILYAVDISYEWRHLSGYLCPMYRACVLILYAVDISYEWRHLSGYFCPMYRACVLILYAYYFFYASCINHSGLTIDGDFV